MPSLVPHSILLSPIPFQLVRFPTPFRKDMKALKAKRKKGKYKPEAQPSTTIFRKGSASSRDDLLTLSTEPSNGNSREDASSPMKKSQESLGDFNDVSGQGCVSGWSQGRRGRIGGVT